MAFAGVKALRAGLTGADRGVVSEVKDQGSLPAFAGRKDVYRDKMRYHSPWSLKGKPVPFGRT